MRLTRRLLAVVSLLGPILILLRHRKIETGGGKNAQDLKAGADAAKASKNRHLPLVILHIDKAEDEEKAAVAAAIKDKPHGGDVQQHPTPQSEGEADNGHGTTAHDVGLFWMKWSRVMYENRPSAQRMRLRGHGQAQPPNVEELLSREPHTDPVRKPEDDINHSRLMHDHFVAQLQQKLGHNWLEEQQQVAGRPSRALDFFKGKGVVMVGGGEYYGPAIISIHMLRRTGSNLPVEVFVPDDSAYEKAVCEDHLKKLGATCVTLSHILDKSTVKVSRQDDADLNITDYHQLKALALLLSSFSDALLLDSDSIPLLDPQTTIFDDEPYTSSGLVVWPDVWTATESPEEDHWTMVGKPDFPAHHLPATASAAGQLAVNKATHLAPLLLATYYHLFGPDSNHHHPLLLPQAALGQADKDDDTFVAAAVALHAPYYRVRTPALALGRHDRQAREPAAVLQHLASDDMQHTSSALPVRPSFLLSNRPKMNAGDWADGRHPTAADGGGRTTRSRLLGSKEDMVARVGFDLEKTIWDLLVHTGCELQHTIEEWKSRGRICETLKEHYGAVFGLWDETEASNRLV